jgi:dTMP kinase
MPDATPDPTRRGLFLSLDGPDGGGKTTQLPRLVQWLRDSAGREVLACRDPGSTDLGDAMRRILFDRSSRHGMRAEMFLFMAARAQLVEQVIRPELEAGKVVVSDRFLLANLVYQGHAGGIPVEEIRQVGTIAADGLLPDLTLVLDIPPEQAAARTGRPRDRIEDRPLAYREAVRNGFRAEASRDPAHIRLIDASAPADAVFEAIRKEVQHVLGTRPRP